MNEPVYRKKAYNMQLWIAIASGILLAVIASIAERTAIKLVREHSMRISSQLVSIIVVVTIILLVMPVLYPVVKTQYWTFFLSFFITRSFFRARINTLGK